MNWIRAMRLYYCNTSFRWWSSSDLGVLTELKDCNYSRKCRGKFKLLCLLNWSYYHWIDIADIRRLIIEGKYELD